MRVERIDPILASKREQRGHRDHEKEKTMIEKRRELFRNKVSRSMKKVYIPDEKGQHIDERI
jgi:hypothetical protein